MRDFFCAHKQTHAERLAYGSRCGQHGASRPLMRGRVLIGISTCGRNGPGLLGVLPMVGVCFAIQTIMGKARLRRAC
jgi:hypothetical protein